MNAIRVRRLQSGSADKHHMSASRLSVPAQQGPTVGMVIELSQAMVVMDKMAASQNIPAMRNVPAKTKSRNSRRLIFLLILFFITILLLLFFHSSYSRITSIEIRGQIYVSEESIKEASGIELNDHFFLVSPEKIEERIEAIKIIKDSVVTKQFPGRVFIDIEEYPEVAYEITPEGRPEAILANGEAVTLADQSVIIDKPILSGWEDQEMKRRLTETLANIPDSLLADISEIKPNPSRSYPDKIIMYTRSFFQIETTIEKLPEKIKVYRPIIEDQLEQNVNGGMISLLEIDRFIPYPEPDENAAASVEDVEAQTEQRD